MSSFSSFDHGLKNAIQLCAEIFGAGLHSYGALAAVCLQLYVHKEERAHRRGGTHGGSMKIRSKNSLRTNKIK
jgi:hypothetical protein